MSKQVEPGVNDLYTWCNNNKRGKQLLSEWTGLNENNEVVDINNIARGSHKNVQWECKNKHKFICTVYERTQGKDCPICRSLKLRQHRKVKNGINDLYTWCINNNRGQQLLSEWVGLDEDNNTISINDVAKSSHIKVQWICKNEHKFIASINERTRGRNCPYCAKIGIGDKIRNGKLREGENDLYTWCTKFGEYGQRVLKEYSSENELDIHSINQYSNKFVKWKCIDCNYEWTTRLSTRTYSAYSLMQGCPHCNSKNQVFTGENDLYTWCISNQERGKQLLDEWTGLDENDDTVDIKKIAQYSNHKIKWKCSKGHIFNAQVNSRTRLKSNCPYCYYERMPEINRVKQGKNDLYTWCLNNSYGETIIKEWTGITEDNKNVNINDVAYGSRRKLIWKCKKGHKFKSAIAERTLHNTGCPYCNNNGTSYPEQFLYCALKQLFPNAENRFKTPKTDKHKSLEFDIAIPVENNGYKALCIEYSPTYWHEGRERIDFEKEEICKEYNVRLIKIIDDSFFELDTKYEKDYICDVISKVPNKQDILNNILALILQSLGHNIEDVDIDKAQKEAFERKTGAL